MQIASVTLSVLTRAKLTMTLQNGENEAGAIFEPCVSWRFMTFHGISSCYLHYLNELMCVCADFAEGGQSGPNCRRNLRRQCAEL